MVVPFFIVYIFNWTIFFIIIVSLLHKSCKSNIKKKRGNISFVRQQLVNVTILSILFGLGWGIGLFATQDIHNNKIVRDLFSASFVIVTAFHGLFIFIMQCIRSNDVRSVWNQWFYRATGKGFSEFTSSTYGHFRNYRLNTSHTDSTSDGGTLKQYYGKQGISSPTSRSSDSTVDDRTVEKSSGNTFKYSVSKPAFPLSPLGDAESVENDKQNMESAFNVTSKEEEVKMIESSFNQTTVTVDCEEKKEVKMMEPSFTTILECVDDQEKVTEKEILSSTSSGDCNDPEANP